jgi:hypothetical protein
MADDIKIHKNGDTAFHISKAKRNNRYVKAQITKLPQFNEWAITGLFYCALHYIDAVLSQDPNLSERYKEPMGHLDRKDAVSNCLSLKDIASLYLQLDDRSRQARYKQTHFPEQVFADVWKNLFIPIRENAMSILGMHPSSDNDEQS